MGTADQCYDTTRRRPSIRRIHHISIFLPQPRLRTIAMTSCHHTTTGSNGLSTARMPNPAARKVQSYVQTKRKKKKRSGSAPVGTTRRRVVIGPPALHAVVSWPGPWCDSFVRHTLHWNGRARVSEEGGPQFRLSCLVLTVFLLLDAMKRMGGGK
jgi:hypothetical protein